MLHGLVDTLTPLTTSTHGHTHCFATPFARTDTYLNSFLPSPKLWNSLPNYLYDFEDIS